MYSSILHRKIIIVHITALLEPKSIVSTAITPIHWRKLKSIRPINVFTTHHHYTYRTNEQKKKNSRTSSLVQSIVFFSSDQEHQFEYFTSNGSLFFFSLFISNRLLFISRWYFTYLIYAFGATAVLNYERKLFFVCLSIFNSYWS